MNKQVAKNNKRRIANRLQQPQKNKVTLRGTPNPSVYQSRAWEIIKEKILRRVEYKEEIAKQHSIQKNLI